MGLTEENWYDNYSDNEAANDPANLYQDKDDDDGDGDGTEIRDNDDMEEVKIAGNETDVDRSRNPESNRCRIDVTEPSNDVSLV